MNEQRIIRPYPGFIIPTRRFIDVGMPMPKMTMEGKYRIKKFLADDVRSDGTVRDQDIIQDTGWFPNILLDSGLNRWGTGSVLAGAAIGTDSSAPSAAQTGLLAQSHYTTTSGTGHGVTSALGSSPYNNTYTVVYRTGVAALNGNYYEVGAGWASGGNMLSRALVLNGGGSPTSISVSSAEQLDIVYQLSVYPPLVDTGPTTVTISGVNYDVTGRACNVNTTSGGSSGSWSPSAAAGAIAAVASFGGANNAYSGTLGAITSNGPSGTVTGNGAPSSNVYVNNSMQRTGYATYGLSEGNVSGGIKSTRFWWTNLAVFQYEFNNVIPKDGTKTLVLNYSLNWARRP